MGIVEGGGYVDVRGECQWEGFLDYDDGLTLECGLGVHSSVD